jgi:hypothetical protein
MKDSSIRNVLGYGLVILLTLSACGRAQPQIETVPIIETRTVQVQRPAPIVPAVDQLRLRNVRWIVVTAENVETILASLPNDAVLFAITADGYEALALNLSDLRALVEQQRAIIRIYEDSYRR